jgi:hypothetical protein
MHKLETFPKCQASTLVGNVASSKAFIWDMASPLGFGGHSHKVRLCRLFVCPSPGLILGMATPLGGFDLP